jgi:hypothetical protein
MGDCCRFFLARLSCLSGLAFSGECLKHENWRAMRGGTTISIENNLVSRTLVGVVTEPFPTRKMRRPPMWPWNLASLTCALAVVLGFWLGAWVLLVPVAGIFFAAWYFHTRVRCPQCSRRLRSRSVSLDEHDWKRRYFYDCADCEITWDPDLVTESD